MTLLLPATASVGRWNLDSVYHVDALALLAGLPDASVDAVITDPPYFGVKDDDWDNQWDSADAFIAWMGTLCQQWRRVLAPNGSLYVFASPRMAARVEVEIGKHFNVLNRITWRKPPFSTKAEMFDKDTMRAYFPASEAIIFAEQFASDGRYSSSDDELSGRVFKPLKDWFRERAISNNIERKAVNAAIGSANSGGGMATHYFGSGPLFELPTETMYKKMQTAFPQAFNREYDDLRREYDDLRREYDVLRREYDDLRRPFAARPDAPYTDVWDFKTVTAYDGKHPCEKPLALMSHIISTSTRPGALILDCFAGSGATLDAARRLNRRFIGCDFDAHWAAYARKRVTLPYTLDMFAEIGVAA